MTPLDQGDTSLDSYKITVAGDVFLNKGSFNLHVEAGVAGEGLSSLGDLDKPHGTGEMVTALRRSHPSRGACPPRRRRIIRWRMKRSVGAHEPTTSTQHMRARARGNRSRPAEAAATAWRRLGPFTPHTTEIRGRRWQIPGVAC